MFLKELTISSESNVIREILFKKGINLIVDNTGKEITGNNVGKTTVLKLIDFCLGANPNGIWIDPESKKDEYALVKNFLKEKKVLISLTLTENLDDLNAKETVIERNFLPRKEMIRRINGNNLTEEEFEEKLSKILFPQLTAIKPTFRQLISHNIRYKDENINNTLRTLDKYTTDAEYETLHLFMLGVEFDQGSSKQEILTKLRQEEVFKSRLEKTQTKSAYETALSLIEGDIEKLNRQKNNFNLNEEYETDLDKLTSVKYRINSASTEITNLNIRRELILEADRDLRNDHTSIDLQQLQIIYEQAIGNIEGIQKQFEDLVAFHNQMIDEKAKFLTKELPVIDSTLSEKRGYIERLLSEEKILTQKIAKSDSFEELEKLIGQLNEKYREKGEYEKIIAQLNEVDEEIKELHENLKTIEEGLFSDAFEAKVKGQVKKFNKYFAEVSEYLYDERYALKYDIITNKKGQKVYRFSAFNTNFSSGKKQGEISCFDIAYTLFADEEGIPCLHFILNDKKELMHGNQLVKINELVNKNNIQFVASILRDKLPPELNKPEYFVVELSQNDKLFRID
jgi:uncharacterized protein YydD (DUF2326 family)